MSLEVVARFQLTPLLWYEASRVVLRRQHRLFSPWVTGTVVGCVLTGLLALDFLVGPGDAMLPLFVLLNVLVPLACLALCLIPFLIRRRFQGVYNRLPEANRAVVWRFSTFNVAAEGGMTRFEGGWDDLHEIVATPEFFLIFRKEKSAGVVPRSAFEGAQAVEDFVYLARTFGPKYVELP